jgi:hypothetical protein
MDGEAALVSVDKKARRMAADARLDVMLLWCVKAGASAFQSVRLRCYDGIFARPINDCCGMHLVFFALQTTLRYFVMFRGRGK